MSRHRIASGHELDLFFEEVKDTFADRAEEFAVTVAAAERCMGWQLSRGKPRPLTEAELHALRASNPCEEFPSTAVDELTALRVRLEIICEFGRDPVGGRLVPPDVAADALAYRNEFRYEPAFVQDLLKRGGINARSGRGRSARRKATATATGKVDRDG